MILSKENPVNGHINQPFLFRKRVEKIDWRRLASVDVHRVANQMDIETLQEVLAPVAFCDITNEIDTQYVDTNIIKLFQLAQLLLEYLLYSQDYLTSTVDSLKGENESLKKQIAGFQKQLAEKTTRLTAVRRECHRRRLLLLAQQQLMDSGPQSYHRCSYCPKAFLNASFLAAHVHRRHPEAEYTSGVTAFAPVESQPMPNAPSSFDRQNEDMATPLEKDVRELLSHLKSNHCTLQHADQTTPRDDSNYAHRIGLATDNATQQHAPTQRISQPEDDLANTEWKTAIMEEHRHDIELLRRTFEAELRELQDLHASTLSELAELKAARNTVPSSNLGELVDDVPKISPRRVMHMAAEGDARPVEPRYTTEPTVDKNTPTEAVGSDLTLVHVSPATSCRYAYPEDSVHGRSHNIHQKTVVGSCESLGLLSRYGTTAHRRSPARTMSLGRDRKARPMLKTTSETDDDRAESDITAPTYVTSAGRSEQRQRRTTTHISNAKFDGRERLAPDETDAFEQRHRFRQHDDQHTADNALTRKSRRIRKRVRSTAIQVGLGQSITRQRPSAEQCTRVEDAVFLKVKRPYSRSGSSTGSQKSLSPKSRRFVRIADGHSREIVIVRTDDEELSTNWNFEEKSELMRSVHLMPVFGETGLYRVVDKRPIDAPCVISQEPIVSKGTQLSTSYHSHSGADVASRGTLDSDRNRVQEVNEVESITSVRTTSSMQPSQHGISDYQYPPATTRPPHKLNQAVVLEESDEDESDYRATQTVRHGLESASTPTHSQKLSASVLRYSRLMDQFRADPETLRSLRHEVEQLLAEQLSERGIDTSQMRISTAQLNACLGALGREREHLARKHTTFKEIRETLNRHVDRLAHAALSGKPIQRLIGSHANAHNMTTTGANLPPQTGQSPSSFRHSSSTDRIMKLVGAQPTTGHSVPTFNQRAQTRESRSISLTRSPNRRERHRFQRSSPQLHMKEECDEQSVTSRQPKLSSGYQGSHQGQQSATSSPKIQVVPGPPHSAVRDHSSALSPVRGATSPTPHSNYHQRIVNTGTKAASSPNLVSPGSDDWDTDSDDFRIDSRTTVGKKSFGVEPSIQPLDADPIDNLEVDLDAAEAMVNSIGREQRNTNASCSSSAVLGFDDLIKKEQSVKTDDEDVCSVSSINGGGLEDNSISYGTTMNRFPNSTVAAIHLETARLGPRPVTRFGRNARPMTVVSTESSTVHRTRENGAWNLNTDSRVSANSERESPIDELNSDECPRGALS